MKNLSHGLVTRIYSGVLQEYKSNSVQGQLVLNALNLFTRILCERADRLHTMPPFDTPGPPFRLSQLRAWSDNVEPQMRNLLWGHYWQQFNTIQIPLLAQSDYFNNAIEVAKLAKGQKAEFERIFKKRNEQQREELLSQMTKAGLQTIYNDEIFPCKDARDTVSKVCSTGCLLDFLQLLIGTAHGWEADAAEDSQSESATGNLNEEILDTDNNFETQWPDDDYYYRTPIERQIREEESVKAAYYIGTFTTYTPNMPASDIPVLEKENKEKIASIIRKNRKRSRSDDNNSEARGHNQELKNTAPSSIAQTSIQHAIDKSVGDDIPTLDSDNNYGHVYKRRKLDSPPALEPINPSSQLPAGKAICRKRSAYNDYDNYDHRHKRRKLESSGACTPCHTSAAQELADEKIAAKKKSRPKDKSHRCDNRKKKKASLKISRYPGPTNTRSLRSTARPIFCELDRLGNKRFI
ncbi:hypothetical protein V8C37DRAFT_392443 [Trichoderma ceciliae]